MSSHSLAAIVVSGGLDFNPYNNQGHAVTIIRWHSSDFGSEGDERLEVFAYLEEEYVLVSTGFDSCPNIPGSGDQFCIAFAYDNNLSNGCVYCGWGTGHSRIPVPGNPDLMFDHGQWGVFPADCQVYEQDREPGM